MIKSLPIILLIVLISPVSAQTYFIGIEHEDIGITTVDTGDTWESNTPSDVGGDGEDIGDESDDNSSNWIRDSQPLGGTTTSDTDADGLTDSVEVESTDKDHKGEIDILSGAHDDTTTSTSQYNESDLDFVNRLVELEAVFVKFDDIKGESDDSASSSDGNPDRPTIIGNVPGGEAANKPKEIVVVGSKVRGWDMEKKESILSASKGIDRVLTETDMILFAASLVNENSVLNRLTILEEETAIHYNHPLKLFGFIPIDAEAEATITFGDGVHGAGEEIEPDDYGRLKVKLPWWHVFGSKTVRASDIVSAFNYRGTSNLDLQNALQKQARGLQTLSNILKNIHNPSITILE